VVLKPAEQTPLSITLLLELIGDLFPAGVLNVVQGFGKEAGEALATSKRIAKLAFTGSTPVGRHILGGKYYPLHCRAGGQIAQHLLRRRNGGRRGVY
jgi:acyl-CoA reductase-like NAD-dependent aldehyde dehydrogenase